MRLSPGSICLSCRCFVSSRVLHSKSLKHDAEDQWNILQACASRTALCC